MKTISQYCATAALAVGLVTTGVQAGNAATHSLSAGGGDVSSSKVTFENAPQLGNLVSTELDKNTQPLNEVKVAGRTGRYIALGVGAAILGSALTANHYNNRRYRSGYRSGYRYSYPRRTYYRSHYYNAPRWAKRKCARRYKSFDWHSGTYVTYGGRVRVCPYLY